MKPALGKVFTLLLCLSLCMLLAPAALAEDAQGLPADTSGQELFPVRFYNGKGYDLIGLQVTDAVGHALDPSSREDGWTYLLAPGAYSYTYHDDRGIFLDLDKTGFTVDGAAEIPLTLRAFLTENANFTVFVNPFYQDTLDEDTIAWHEAALSEELDRVVAHLAADEDASGLSQSDVFYGSENEIAGYAATLRAALIAREPSVSLTVYSGNTRWNPDNYMSVLLEVYQKAFQHTGNQQEGDTLRWEVYSYGYGGGTYNNYDSNKQSYYHVIPYSFTYQSSAAQEAETAAEVERVVQSLSLNGKSDYEKFAAINEYLYMNVNYDYSYQKHSSYNALIERNSVCQGFATAFYRLSLAAGLDARVVSSSTMGHGWNIAKLGNHYYYLDATWDSNWREQGYPLSLLPYFFIHGSNWWLENHTLEDDNGNLISGLGDEFGYTSDDLYYDPAFATYVVSDAEFDPTAVGVAVASTNFPDEIFRDYVSANCDTDGDGYLSDEEITAVTSIDVGYYPQLETSPYDYYEDMVFTEADSFNASAPYVTDDISGASGISSALAEAETFGAESAGSITSLKGIEFFTALQNLYCCGNQISELDVSANTALKTLVCGVMFDDQCSGNGITSLNVSNNPDLTVLACDGNCITTLDLSRNTKLEVLMCSGNQLSNLNLSGLSTLQLIHCFENRLTSLNLSGCSGLVELRCQNNQLTGLNVSGCTSLQNLVCWKNNLTSLDVSDNTALVLLGCDTNELTVLDLSHNPALQTLYCYSNKLTTLNVSGCSELLELNCAYNQLTSLNIRDCTKLQGLYCSNNYISSLDISNKPDLDRLYCIGSQLTSLDTSHNTALRYLSCWNNRLQALDISGNPNLVGLACHENNLAALDISSCAYLVFAFSVAEPSHSDGYYVFQGWGEGNWLLFDENVSLSTSLLTLPASLTTIEDEAFANGAFTFVKLSEQTVSIGALAFANCPNLMFVYIPANMEYIDPTAFSGSEVLFILGFAGTPAQTYAEQHGFYFLELTQNQPA